MRPPKSKTFRVGRVVAYLWGRVWHLRYHEHDRRRQTRAGPDKAAARQLRAQVNAQLETGAAGAAVNTSSEPVRLESSGIALIAAGAAWRVWRGRHRVAVRPGAEGEGGAQTREPRADR